MSEDNRRSDYDRIAKAIAFLSERVPAQPSLDDVAAHLHLSPFHFQRMFCRWAGISPKRFLQVMTLESGKRMLDASQSLLEASSALGLSSTSRLHDHFVHLEAVTPGEYKSRGEGLRIEHGVHPTPFGDVFVAVTGRGVCRVSFVSDEGIAAHRAELQRQWPLAELVAGDRPTRAVVTAMFERPLAAGRRERSLPLYVSGTNFQIAVWRALLRIPPGRVVSYRGLAEALGRPRSARAVGNAVGANPVAFIIPCHRVIQESGALGGYRWGREKKRLMQVWETARLDGVKSMSTRPSRG